MVCKQKSDLIKLIEAVQKFTSSIKIKHINTILDANFIRDNSRNSLNLTIITDTKKSPLSKGQVTESFTAQNKFEISVEKDEIVDIIESNKKSGYVVIRRENMEQGVVPPNCVSEIRKKELAKNVEMSKKKAVSSARRLPDRNTISLRDSLVALETEHELSESSIDRKSK